MEELEVDTVQAAGRGTLVQLSTAGAGGPPPLELEVIGQVALQELDPTRTRQGAMQTSAPVRGPEVNMPDEVGMIKKMHPKGGEEAEATKETPEEDEAAPQRERAKLPCGSGPLIRGVPQRRGPTWSRWARGDICGRRPGNRSEAQPRRRRRRTRRNAQPRRSDQKEFREPAQSAAAEEPEKRSAQKEARDPGEAGEVRSPGRAPRRSLGSRRGAQQRKSRRTGAPRRSRSEVEPRGAQKETRELVRSPAAEEPEVSPKEHPAPQNPVTQDGRTCLGYWGRTGRARRRWPSPKQPAQALPGRRSRRAQMRPGPRGAGLGAQTGAPGGLPSDPSALVAKGWGGLVAPAREAGIGGASFARTPTLRSARSASFAAGRESRSRRPRRKAAVQRTRRQQRERVQLPRAAGPSPPVPSV